MSELTWKQRRHALGVSLSALSHVSAIPPRRLAKIEAGAEPIRRERQHLEHVLTHANEQRKMRRFDAMREDDELRFAETKQRQKKHGDRLTAYQRSRVKISKEEGKALQQRRSDLHVSREDFGLIVGCSRSVVWEIEAQCIGRLETINRMRDLLSQLESGELVLADAIEAAQRKSRKSRRDVQTDKLDRKNEAARLFSDHHHYRFSSAEIASASGISYWTVHNILDHGGAPRRSTLDKLRKGFAKLVSELEGASS